MNLWRSLIYKHRIEVAQQYGAQGPEQARQVSSLIFGMQNSLKVYVGRDDALKDKEVIAKKQAEEDDFRRKVDGNPEWKREYRNAWPTIASAVEKEAAMFPSNIYRRTDSQFMSLALADRAVCGGDQEARWRASGRVSRGRP